MTKFIKNNKSFGFGIIGIIIIFAVIAVLGGFFGYQYLKLQNIREEAKAPAAEPPVIPSAQIQPQTEEIDTSTWKTYRNEKYGFEVRYPSSFGIPKEDGSAVSFSNNQDISLYISGAPYKRHHPDQLKTSCGVLGENFLYCRYFPLSENRWILIKGGYFFMSSQFALNATTDPLPYQPDPNDPNDATFLNIYLELPELEEIRDEDRIKITKTDLSDEIRWKVEEFDQILSTFKFTK